MSVASKSRRRVVSDVDCDGIEEDVDTVETTCASYRYDVMQSLWPLLNRDYSFDTGTQTVIESVHGAVSFEPVDSRPSQAMVLDQLLSALCKSINCSNLQCVQCTCRRS